MQTVIFRIHDDEYALPVMSVAEVIRMVALRTWPDTPAWIAGVVNLRGNVIPVIDLRKRLHFDASPLHSNTPILIVTAGNRRFGVIVDALVEVADLPDANIEQIAVTAPPQFAVQQLAHLAHRVIMILAPDRLSESALMIA
jgi:purine-binding chemotaxis protein CheW